MWWMAIVWVAAGLVSPAMAQQAHVGLLQNVEPCIAKMGPTTLTFTFYQPMKSRSQYCADIPDSGPTVIVVDSMQDELRDMNLELRIVRDPGNEEADIEAVAEAYVPPARFAAGVIEYEHDFTQSGRYVAHVRARDETGRKEYNSTFSFTVGERSWRDVIATAFLTMVGLSGFGLWCREAFPKVRSRLR